MWLKQRQKWKIIERLGNSIIRWKNKSKESIGLRVITICPIFDAILAINFYKTIAADIPELFSLFHRIFVLLFRHFDLFHLHSVDCVLQSMHLENTFGQI